MRVLMLGGTGAMGRPLAKILASRGAEVVITSRSRSGSDKKGMEYRQGDAHDIGFLKRLLKDFYDVIIIWNFFMRWFTARQNFRSGWSSY